MNILEPTHLLILAVVVLVLFGAKKIPEFMHGVGKGVGELQKGLAESKRAINTALEDAKTTEAAPATTEAPKTGTSS